MREFNRALCLISILLIIFSFAACGNNAEARKVRISADELAVSADMGNESIYISTSKKSQMKKAAQSGVLEMYLDEKTTAVCVYDTISGKLWRSLPQSYRGEKTANISVDIIIDGREYTLDSQSDSLAFGCCEYKIQDKSIVINYSFRKSLDKNKKIDITVPVSYTLNDGLLNVEINCNDIVNSGTKDVIIKGIHLLPYFGANSEAKEGDYILLPDGCGISLDLYKKAKKFDTIEIPVYGEDTYEPDAPGGAPVGAFGMKMGDTAFIGLIKQGEETATLVGDKALSETSYNKVGAYFEITPTLAKENSIYISGQSYSGIIQLQYRFLSGDNADYVGMAAACRELLIRNGDLTDGNIKDEEYPFNLSLKMTQERQNDKGKTETVLLTSFSEAYELLASLKAKGFGNINLRMTGLFEKGGNKILSGPGSQQEFDVLEAYASLQGISLFNDVALYSLGKNDAVSIDGTSLNVSSPTSLDKQVNSLIYDLRKGAFHGVCLNDCGKHLFSDFSSGRLALRRENKERISKQCGAISASTRLMIDGSSLYSIKYAGTILNMPGESSERDNKYCSDVPFIQALLHGIVDYSLSPSNLSEDSTYAMLKSVEYGALPYYEWYCSDLSDEGETDKFYYMNSVSEAQIYYEKMKNTFSDLRDQRITEHRQVKKNLWLTQYGEGSKVYVNYGDEAVTVSGVIIDPRSFQRVN